MDTTLSPSTLGLAGVPAITVYGEYARAIAEGRKPVENRTWITHHRGWLLIHAGKRSAPAAAAFCATLGVDLGADIPRAAVVALARLTDICSPGDDCRCGPWAMPGQHHWQLVDVIPLLEPVPALGRQQLWYPSNDLRGQLEQAVRDTLEGVVIECTGRARDRYGDALSGRAGRQCGTQYVGQPGRSRADVIRDARLLDWRIGPDTDPTQQAMCPTCGSPRGDRP